MKKNIFVMVALIVAFSFVSSSAFAGGFKIKLPKKIGDFLEDKGKQYISARLDERFNEKSRDRDDQRQVNRDNNYQNNDVIRDGIQSRNQALNEVNNWYREQLTEINRRYHEKTLGQCEESRENLKKLKSEDLAELKAQYNDELV